MHMDAKFVPNAGQVVEECFPRAIEVVQMDAQIETRACSVEQRGSGSQLNCLSAGSEGSRGHRACSDTR